MKARRITHISLDIEETFTIRRSTGSIQAHCPQCGSLTPLVTLGESATLLDVTTDVIAREIKSGRLHSCNTASGAPLICFESVKRTAPFLLPCNSKLHINPQKEISK